MKFLIISDLHLEFRKTGVEAILQKVIAAFRDQGTEMILDAGDVHPYPEVRKYVSGRMEEEGIPYFSVMGNHDFYGHQLIRPDRHELRDYSLVGATLWTDFDNGDSFIMHKFGKTLADGNQIKSNKNDLEDEMLEIHKEDLQFISDSHAAYVVTHHAPSFKSVHPKFHVTGYVNNYFYSDLEQFILDHPHIRLWVHGHMHDPSDYMIGNCRVIANPLGYPSERALSEWEPLLVDI